MRCVLIHSKMESCVVVKSLAEVSEPISMEVLRLRELTTLEMPEVSAALNLPEEDLLWVDWREEEKTLLEKFSSVKVESLRA